MWGYITIILLIVIGQLSILLDKYKQEKTDSTECDRIHFEGDLKKEACDTYYELREKTKLVENYRKETRQNDATIVRLSKEIAALKENEKKLAAERMASVWQKKRGEEQGARWQTAYRKVDAQLTTANEEYQSLIEWTDLRLQRHEKAYASLQEKYGALAAEYQEVEAKLNEVLELNQWYERGYTKKDSNCPPASLVFEKVENRKRRLEDQKARKRTDVPAKPVCPFAKLTEPTEESKELVVFRARNPSYKVPAIEGVREEREE